MEKKRITILPHQFNDNDYFLLKFNYDEGLVSIARSLGCRWLVPEQGWAIYRSRENLRSVVRAFSDISIVDTSKIGIASLNETYGGRIKEVPEEYSNVLIRKGFNEKTIRIYKTLFREFVNHFPDKKLKEIDSEAVLAYLKDQIRIKKISAKTQEQLIEAINLYYGDILKRENLQYPLETPVKGKNSQPRLSKKELALMLKVTKNVKHRAIISLLDSTDLKRSELVGLKKEDVNLEAKRIKPKRTKDQKNKEVVLEPKTKEILRHYLELYKPELWLFEGANGKKYANSSILSVLRRASFKAGLDKEIPKSKRDPESETNWGS